ncbi:universal stress protein PHOS34 [Dioscorea cayenensis subsp. rotundata]|uniref:Universal stress protein PHOS34 n=1 Tax=Dioscorea cayennensis subsp. rotundata TaxID=55577 RepID=A0AB40BM59_DIOCR|nr:universal stress protein PHOS34 [Dioscorea cayenensis subsp. rotundata]
MAAAAEKTPMMVVVGVDDSEHSYYAIQWVLRNFLSVTGTFKLAIIHAQPSPAYAVGLSGTVGFFGAGTADALPYVESDLTKISSRVIEKAKELCSSSSVKDVVYEVIEGDPRNILPEAVEKYHADVLVVGSHGYGAIKRAVLGSVSDHCAHHAHCTVMIVKNPKPKH